jgi:hypothetical protein
MSEGLGDIYHRLGLLDYDPYRVGIVAMAELVSTLYAPRVPAGAEAMVARTLDRATNVAEGGHYDRLAWVLLVEDWRKLLDSPLSDTDDIGVVDLLLALEMLTMKFAGVATKFFAKEYITGVVQEFVPADGDRSASQKFVREEIIDTFPSGDVRSGVIRRMSEVLDNAEALVYPARPGYVRQVQESRQH